MKINKELFNKIKNEVFKPEESSYKKALSIGFGSFMAFTPIWGFQMLACIPFIILFRLNKVLVLVFANASIAPLLPLIIYASFKVGGFFVNSNQIDLLDWRQYSLDTIQENVIQYVLGSLVIAVVIGFSSFIISLIIMKAIRKEKIRSKN